MLSGIIWTGTAEFFNRHYKQMCTTAVKKLAVQAALVEISYKKSKW